MAKWAALSPFSHSAAARTGAPAKALSASLATRVPSTKLGLRQPNSWTTLPKMKPWHVAKRGILDSGDVISELAVAG